jgi:hypothetical protein
LKNAIQRLKLEQLEKIKAQQFLAKQVHGERLYLDKRRMETL